MSIKAIQWVWDSSRSQNGQRLVLLAIADCANGDGGNAFPSVAELMRKANLSERAVRYAIEGLVALGELEVSTNGGRRGTNRYRVVMDLAESAGSHNSEPADSARSAADSARSAADSAPVTVNEPSTQPSSSSDADAPNAGQLLSKWIDWLAERDIQLTNQQKARYAKELKQAVDSKIKSELIGKTLMRMFQLGKLSNPQTFQHVLIDLQSAQPVSGPPASKPFVQQADEYKATKEQVSKVRIKLISDRVDELEALGLTPGDAVKQATAEVEAHMAQSGLASSSSVPYIEGVILAEEPKEVTGS